MGMTEEALNPGDVVQLKSGGLDMTYSGDDSFGRAICVWFDTKNEAQEKPFDKVAIQKKKPLRGF
jgi:uncharacterized protein YodC (DUF2158 family)